MVIVRKQHIGEELFFQILNKFGDSWGWPIEMKSSALQRWRKAPSRCLSDELAFYHRLI